MSKTTSMPTPNIPDEVVEAAAKALADAIGHGMTEKCEAHARLVIEAALPLLLEQKGYAYSGPLPYEDFTKFRRTPAEDYEPLYRLKVSK